MRFEIEHQIERGDTPVLLNVMGEGAGNTGLRVNVLDGSWCARVDLEWHDGVGLVLLYRKEGQDLAAREEPNEPIVLVKAPAPDDASVRVETTPLFWDCECEKDYIHRRGALIQCPVCHADAEEMPDARVNETLAMLDEKIASYQRDLDSGLVTLRAGWMDVISMFKSWRAQVAQGE